MLSKGLLRSIAAGIRGDLRDPKSSNVIAANVTPAEAFEGASRMVIPAMRDNSVRYKELTLDIDGIGIIMYSPSFSNDIPIGSNYLRDHYTSSPDVQQHIQKGTIVGFGTGTPGRFILRFHLGDPEDELLKSACYALRLGLHCVDGVICVRDLYDLMEWSPECSAAQRVELPSGFLRLTLISERPESGILGDDQQIDVFCEPVPGMPSLAREGIPTLIR